MRNNLELTETGKFCYEINIKGLTKNIQSVSLSKVLKREDGECNLLISGDFHESKGLMVQLTSGNRYTVSCTFWL